MFPLSRRIAILGGKPSNYLLRDDFTDTRAAGAVNNTSATPGPGTRDVTDTGSDLTIGANDYLYIAVGTNAWNDPVIAWDEGLIRGAGAMMAVMRFGLQTSTSGCWLNAAAKPAAPGTNGHGFQSASTAAANYILGALGGGNTVIPSTAYARMNVDHLIVIIPKPVGAYVLVCSPHLGAWPAARLLWVDEAGTDTPLYAGVAPYTINTPALAKTVRFIKASALPASWFTQWGLATAYDTFTRADGAPGAAESGQSWSALNASTWAVSSNKIVNTVLGTGNWSYLNLTAAAEGWFEVDYTVPAANGFCGVLFRCQDAANHWKLMLRQSTNILYLYKVVATVQTTVTSTALVVGAGNTVRLRVSAVGSRITCLVNDTYYLTASDTDLQAATGAGVVCYNNLDGIMDNFAAWPSTVTLPDIIDFPVDPPAGVGSALETDAFTADDGTALATYNNKWTVGAGTWEVRSNKAQQTAAAATGHAVMDAGTPDHEAQVTIVMPAAPGVVNDWFPGVVVRYTDTNNYVSARFLYQANSPEIEVWERVGGGAEVMLGGVNLGAGNLNAGSTQTLKVAIKGQEAAVYLGGTLRLQCTTTLLTGNKAGIGTMAICEGQPTYDDWQLKAA